MKLCALSLLLLLALRPAAARADEQVRRVQEELRKRNLFFGEVDGRLTAETATALRRYQTRKGFPPTGELAVETLRSLILAEPAKAGVEWPEVPVLRSDAAREVRESDRPALEAQAEKELAAVGEAPPEEERVEPIGPVGGVEKGPEAAAGSDLAEQARHFVTDYLAACTTNHLDAEMRFYADPLVYFDHGKVERAFVARDVEHFYRRWPERRYELLDFQAGPEKNGEREVVFRIAFQYKGAGRAAAGRTLNHFKIHEDAGGLHFDEMKEARVRE